MRRLPRPLLALALTCVPAVAPAAARSAAEAVASAAARRTVLVASDELGAFASAPGWAAFFRAGEVRFAPAARTGERVPDLGLVLEHVRRGAAVRPAAPVRPAVADRRVTYAHPGFAEVWDARPEGLKQSFVFPTAPAGTGELVVRLRLDTALVPAAVRPDGLLLAHAGAPVARIGAVVAVDAVGREATGELRLAGDRLELVLPEEVVDAAAYPLVLDPLIAPVTKIASTGAADADPDVAWDADTERYCVVWRRDYSSSKAITLAQIFEADGTPVGPIASLGWSFAWGVDPVDVAPAVCNVGASDLFVLASAERTHGGDYVRVTAMSAHTMSMRAFRLRAPRLWHLDVGGEGAEGRTGACLVWNNHQGVFARRLAAESLSELRPLDEEDRTVADGDTDAWETWASVRISQTAGQSGRWLVAWEHWPAPDTSDVEVRSVERSGAMGPIWELTGSGTARRPSCDGDGDRFFVSFVEGSAAVHGAVLDLLPSGEIAWSWSAPLVGSRAEPALDPQVAMTFDAGAVFTLSVRRSGYFRVEYRTFAATLEELSGPTLVWTRTDSHRIASRWAADLDAPSHVFAVGLELRDALARAVAAAR